MKANRIIPTLALLVSMVGLSTACAEQESRIQFNSYWNDNSQVMETVNETVEYDVTFTADSTPLVTAYKISYSDGTYVTNLSTHLEDGKTVYVYTTELNIKVNYTLNGQSLETPLSDYVKTTTKFYDVSNSLKPISSTKEFVSHSPTNNNPSKLENCYGKFHYKLETNYDASGNGKCEISNLYDEAAPKKQTTSFTTISKKYSYLDNDQLLFGLRGIPKSVSSASVVAYSPFVKNNQVIDLSFSAETGDKFNFEYVKNGKTVPVSEISYRPVSIKLNGKNPGETQTAYIASPPESSNSNIYHNLVLRYEAPIAYSLGKLVYTVSKVTYENGLD